MNNKPLWQSLMVLGQEYWQIDLIIGNHETEEEATKVAKSDFQAMLGLYEGNPAILVTSEFGKAVYFDDNIVITEINEEKKAKMGRPLDMENSIDKDIALQALINFDSAYVIDSSDMIPSTKQLADFITHYGSGYILDHIAWGVTAALSKT